MEQKVLSYLKAHEDRITEDIRMLVRQEGCSAELDALQLVEEKLLALIKERLGLDAVCHDAPGGHHPISVTWGTGAKKIMLVGHYDTVHPVGSFPIREEADRLYGPGILDMKGGIVAGIWAMKALQTLAGTLDAQVILYLSGDEEIGSGDAKALMCEMAEYASAAIILEPAFGEALKTGRKGQMKLTVDITGKASHSGTDHEKGISAIEELAHEILYCQSLTDYSVGTTLNVGLCSGGTKPNIVPDTASMTVDCRYLTMAECDRIRTCIQNLPVTVKGTSRTVTVHSAVAPMERNEKNLHLYGMAQEIGKEYGMDLTETVSGGRSDGNFLAAMQIPVLDGMGMAGEGAHTKQEYILRSQIVPKTALTAALIYRLSNESI